VRKECWQLSLKGKAIVAATTLVTALIGFFNIHPFLAVTHREDSKILVVEGWVDQYAILAAVKEFQAGHYEKIYTTGGPGVGTGGYVNDFNTTASIGAEMLVKAGLPPEAVQMVPSHISGRDRTYSSALALEAWFRDQHLVVTNFNVLTEDVHARRTWLLFRKAFGKGVKVGIITVPNPDYDPRRWWRYSEGVREVLGETIAYIYARLLFWPSR